MARTNIEIDDDLVTAVMRRNGFKSKREAVDYALRVVSDEAYTAQQLAGLGGTGFWDGDPVAAELDPEEFPELFDRRPTSA